MTDFEALAAQAGVALTQPALAGLRVYRDMLLEWNRHMDLTSVAEGDVAARHFLDSLLPLSRPGLLPDGARVIDAHPRRVADGDDVRAGRDRADVVLRNQKD